MWMKNSMDHEPLKSADLDLHCFQKWYGKSSKILNTSWLQKRSRQTVQTKIRLLLKKQSDQGLPCLLFLHAFCEFQPRKPTFLLRREREKCSKF